MKVFNANGDDPELEKSFRKEAYLGSYPIVALEKQLLNMIGNLV
jgi:hypothetical protein